MTDCIKILKRRTSFRDQTWHWGIIIWRNSYKPFRRNHFLSYGISHYKAPTNTRQRVLVIVVAFLALTHVTNHFLPQQQLTLLVGTTLCNIHCNIMAGICIVQCNCYNAQNNKIFNIQSFIKHKIATTQIWKLYLHLRHLMY